MMKRLTAALGLALMVLLVGAPASPAAFGLNGFDVNFANEDGTPATHAGSHPFEMWTVFNVNYHADPKLGSVPDGELKQLQVELPVGFAGNPTAVPQCSPVDLVTINPITEKSACPDNTAVGAVVAAIVNPIPEKQTAVFNMEPPPGVAAELGFLVSRVPVTIDIPVNNSAPYNVSPLLVNIPQAVKFFASKLVIWGNPASPVHDPFRGACLDTKADFSELRSVGNCPSDAPEKPFITLPRACSGPLATTYSAVSWQEPKAAPVEGASLSELQTTECDELEFGPTITAETTAVAADSPSGLDFSLEVDDPELTSPTGVADSDIKKAVVTLPGGVTTNPSIATGLGACTLAQYQSETVSSDPGTGCPGNSKVGSVEVETPLLEDKILRGAIYVAKQGDNPFNNLLTIYMVIKDPELGILVRAAGKVDPDSVTGQLTTTFDELPQLPFSHFRLHFRTGERAPLITPPLCGTYETAAKLYPYADPDVPVEETASMDITSGAGGAPCAPSMAALPHSPTFSAGTISSKAGAFSPFVFNLSRADGSQQLGSVTTTLPQGLLGRLAGIPYCSEAELAAAAARGGEGQGALELAQPSCPAASQLGSVIVGAGAGNSPLYVPGKAYLAGPYKGAPLSLAIITPAIAGPFDLGVVVVRTALQVDLTTAQITAISDPIPTILHGLPLDVRSVAINMDRPSFTLNPTSCEPTSVLASATSTLAQIVQLSHYFQSSACDKLGFKPDLALKFTGRTTRAGHPSLRAVVTYPKKGAYSNIARAAVTLPATQGIDNAHINNPCTRVQFAQDACPPSSILGSARAFSPLIDKPLEGPVYFRSNGDERPIPDIVADLQGQIHVVLVGGVDSVPTKRGSSRIRTTFFAAPDAPVSKFTLNLFGGKRGLLVNSTNICKADNHAIVRFTAHNGKRHNARPEVKNSCGKSRNTKTSAR